VKEYQTLRDGLDPHVGVGSSGVVVASVMSTGVVRYAELRDEGITAAPEQKSFVGATSVDPPAENTGVASRSTNPIPSATALPSIRRRIIEASVIRKRPTTAIPRTTE
jgi:hypothetical protein